MNKKLTAALVILAIIIIGFFVYRDYSKKANVAINPSDQTNPRIPATPTTPTNPPAKDFSDYFQSRMIAIGIDAIGGHPIEGFDASLLLRAYPGLKASDFAGVEAVGGKYTVSGNEVVFVRSTPQPVTSAEGTVSNVGYGTLLKNVSTRLNFEVKTEGDVDRLIERIHEGEMVQAKIGQSVTASGMTITPREVLEDSRCPLGVMCIQAGTVRLRVTVDTASQTLSLGNKVVVGDKSIALVQVDPIKERDKTIASGDYVFHFEIR